MGQSVRLAATLVVVGMATIGAVRAADSDCIQPAGDVSIPGVIPAAADAGTELSGFSKVSLRPENALLGPGVDGCGIGWSGSPQGSKLQFSYAETGAGGGAGAGGRPRARAGRVGMTALENDKARWRLEAAFRHNEKPGARAAVAGVASRLALADGALRLLSDAAVAPAIAGRRGGGAVRQRVEMARRLGSMRIAAHAGGGGTEAGFRADGIDADRMKGEAGFRLTEGRASFSYGHEIVLDDYGMASGPDSWQWRSDSISAGLDLWPEVTELPDRVVLAARRAFAETNPRNAGAAPAASATRGFDGSLHWRGIGWRTQISVATSRTARRDATMLCESGRTHAGAIASLDLGEWSVGLTAGGARRATEAGLLATDTRVGMSLEWEGLDELTIALTAAAQYSDDDLGAEGWRLGFRLDPTGPITDFLPNRTVQASVAYRGEVRYGPVDERNHQVTAAFSLGF